METFRLVKIHFFCEKLLDWLNCPILAWESLHLTNESKIWNEGLRFLSLVSVLSFDIQQLVSLFRIFYDSSLNNMDPPARIV